MTITLKIPSKTEARLIVQASARGMSVETYLMSLIEEHMTLDESADREIQDWEVTLAKLGQSPSLLKVPPLSDEDISRDNIYRDRENCQL